MTQPIPARTATEATFIPLAATAGQEDAVAGLLTAAADLVRGSEPQTLQWLALRGERGGFAIIDFFADEQGRAAHFAGTVAATLRQAAATAVDGGWERGVVARVENSRVLSSTVTGDRARKAALAVRIDFRAQPGKEEALAAFLAGGGELVRKTEPGTLLWYAIRLEAARFAIFDVFADEAGKAAHFAGAVAAALKGRADDLVQGGWTGGVLAGIANYRVLSSTY